MPRVNYSTSPRDYRWLIESGVSPAQIRDAINSGLNPAQLPPEYYGISGGYTPQAVGPGSTPSNEIGGIDIPPASMYDPYSLSPFMGSSASGGFGGVSASGSAVVGDPFWGSEATDSAPSTGSPGQFGTTLNFGFPSDFNFGDIPSSNTSYLGVPGFYDPFFGSTSGADASYTQYASGSANVGDPFFGSVAGGFLGGEPGSVEIATDPFGGLSASGSATFDPFAGASGSSEATFDPFAGVQAGGSTGSQIDPFAGSTAGGSAGGSPFTIDPASLASIAGTPGSGFPPGYTPFGGGGAGPNFGYSGTGIAGGSGGGGVWATPYMHGGVDPFGGGTGGIMPVGFMGPESHMSFGTAVSEGEGGGFESKLPHLAAKAGISADEFEARMTDPATAPVQYITGYQWQKNPGFGGSSFETKGGGFGWEHLMSPSSTSRGWWAPVYGPTPPVTPPPVIPTGHGK